MVSYNGSFLNYNADVIGVDFLFLLPEVFLALALSGLLIFGSCV